MKISRIEKARDQLVQARKLFKALYREAVRRGVRHKNDELYYRYFVESETAIHSAIALIEGGLREMSWPTHFRGGKHYIESWDGANSMPCASLKRHAALIESLRRQGKKWPPMRPGKPQ